MSLGGLKSDELLADVVKREDLSFDDVYNDKLRTYGGRFLAAYIEAKGLTEEQYGTVVKDIQEGLRWEKKEYDFLGSCESGEKVQWMRLALGVFGELKETDSLDVLVLVSQYLNSKVPWSNDELAQMAQKFQKEYGQAGSRFLERIKPSLLSIPNVKVSLSGYKRAGSKAAGLRPSLGFSGVASGIFEDDKRKEWKHSENITALSTVCGFLAVPDDSAEFQANWPVAITFILNVLDDSDPLFRAQGCYLVENALELGHSPVLMKSGHVDLFLESTETCLNYLPNLTPANVSLCVLGAAYPLLYKLKALRKDPVSSYIEVLEKNVLGSISHVQGRNSDRGTNEVLSFLLSQACSLIANHLGAAVLGCFLRLNYTLCQTITNPFLIDADGGAEVVDMALNVHDKCLTAFIAVEDKEGRELFASHKYDLLAAWIVLLKRVMKFKAGTTNTKDRLLRNVKGLSEIVGVDEIKEDYQAALESNPESLPSWDQII